MTEHDDALSLDMVTAALRADSTDVAWRKSSRSANSTGQCVEAGIGSGHVAIRDSKYLEGAALMATAGDWQSLLDTIKHCG